MKVMAWMISILYTKWRTHTPQAIIRCHDHCLPKGRATSCNHLLGTTSAHPSQCGEPVPHLAFGWDPLRRIACLCCAVPWKVALRPRLRILTVGLVDKKSTSSIVEEDTDCGGMAILQFGQSTNVKQSQTVPRNPSTPHHTLLQLAVHLEMLGSTTSCSSSYFLSTKQPLTDTNDSRLLYTVMLHNIIMP